MKQVLFLLFFSPTLLFAQSSSTFRLVNPSNQAVEGALVVHSSSGKHTHTNERGEFVLENLLEGDTLFISHLGYKKKTYRYKGSAQTPIVLEEQVFSLNEVVISPESDALQLLVDINTEQNPVNSSQEILRQVPGLFIGQHAGGGKAEQIFLRGFDIDHGTDIAISVDGIPVNMVSHAHGQGYADLHFLIPETIQRIGFGKGSYLAEKGNFATAGHVGFETKEHLSNNLLKVEIGQFDTQRAVALLNLLQTERHNAYFATEQMRTDGPFESPQHFKRRNWMGKYKGMLKGGQSLEFLVTHFNSEWDASGQIPQRAVDDGTITRFGAIDDTEGGNTSRTNLSLRHSKALANTGEFTTQAYWVNYNFTLFSNFTFFLTNPLAGDQIKQTESRGIVGLSTKYNQGYMLGRLEGNWEIGTEMREDAVNDNELSRTANRKETLQQMAFGDVNESNSAIFLSQTLHGKNWHLNTGIRYDFFRFAYTNKLLSSYEVLAMQKCILSPKISFFFTPSPTFQAYTKAGKGFHSNDTRLVIAERGREVLPAAYTGDAGLIWKPRPEIMLNVAYWYLFLEQEFVYVGDEGIVEPSGRSRRHGVELSTRSQLLPWLFWNLDANYTFARAIDEPSGFQLIPLAPIFTLMSTFTVSLPRGLHGSAQIRHLADRSANEDNSLVATGYTVVDMNLSYPIKNLVFGIQVQNVLNTEWNETQFATESRLFNEGNPVEEIHFTPGTPFFAKAGLTYTF